MSLLLTLNIILTFFSSVSNVVCEHVFFRLNMTTIVVATITIYVNTTVIMIVTGTTTMIMIMAATATMAKIFKEVQQDNFYCMFKMIKKTTKIQFSILF